MVHTSHSFWQKVVAVTQSALDEGALQPISTQLKIVPDRGIPFAVRIVDSLNRKEIAQKKRQNQPKDKPFNPFLPYEEALFVEDLSSSHVCLLNKYNVVDHHLLIVTREYQSQDSWLSYSDFEALVRCLWVADGLGFYNGGYEAGASQHHKHLQLIPLNSPDGTEALPISSMIRDQKNHWETHQRLPSLPFWHSLYELSLQWNESHLNAISDRLLRTYRQIMADLGMNLQGESPDAPYNLLITRDWMMGIRRSQASYQGIGVNSLGYGGWLLVKTAADLEKLKHIGPMNLLQQVGCPPPASAR